MKNEKRIAVKMRQMPDMCPMCGGAVIDWQCRICGQHYEQVLDMSEFDPSIVPADSFCTESHIGPTPNGGAYSVATYWDKFGEYCEKDKACRIGIVEYDADGQVLFCIDGFCGKEENREFSEEEIEYYTKVKQAYEEVCNGMSAKIACYKLGLPLMTSEELYYEQRKGYNVPTK